MRPLRRAPRKGSETAPAGDDDLDHGPAVHHEPTVRHGFEPHQRREARIDEPAPRAAETETPRAAAVEADRNRRRERKRRAEERRRREFEAAAAGEDAPIAADDGAFVARTSPPIDDVDDDVADNVEMRGSRKGVRSGATARAASRRPRQPFDDDVFAPAAEQALGARHSPLFGALALSILGLVVSAVAWSAWAEVERVVSAVGRFEPSEQVKLINHPIGGRVAELMVRDGQQVEEGQVLALFDGERSRRARDEVLGRYQFLATQAARLQVEANGGAFSPPADVASARPDLVESQMRLLDARDQALLSRADALDRLIAAREGESRSTAADLARLENSAALLLQQLKAVRELAAQGLFPKLRLVEVERSYSDALGEIEKAEARVQAAQSSVAEARSRREGLERDWRTEVLSELADVEAERDQLGAQIAQRDVAVEQLALVAPVDGVVQDLQITGVGQSVAANQPLMKLVPEEGELVVQAQIANEDVGHLTPGQAARIKVRAFDYLRFGALAGEIETIARDSTPQGEGEREELAYAVTVKVPTTAADSGQVLDLSPGMLADVEIKIGTRTLLSYFTDRLAVLRDDALEES